MSQGLIVGGTNYQEQSINDIKEDIDRWISYSSRTSNFFTIIINELNALNYWNENVPFNFRMWCEDFPKICETFICDLEIILKDIHDNSIRSNTIKLLNNIYTTSHEYYKKFKTAYKEDTYWKKYEDQKFKKAEELYSHGGDFLCTLFDASNMACRLEDYMEEDKVERNIIEINSSNINIGNNNSISTNINQNTDETKTTKNKLICWLGKWWWSVVIPIAVAVIAAIIISALNIN